MRIRYWWLFATAVFAGGPANAQSATPDFDKVDRMQRQMEQLQEQMKQQQEQMKRQIKQVEGELVEAKKKAAEKATASPFDGAYATDGATKAPVAPPSTIVLLSKTNAPSICTPDQQNCISLTSRLHLDVGGYNYRPATGRGLGPSTSATPGVPIQPATTPQSLDDGYNVRRARIGIQGKFMSDWNYALIYDFGGSSDGFGGLAPGSLPGGGTSGVQNAWLSYSGFSKWTGLTGFVIEGGVTDVMYTLDEATSSNDIMFMERASSQVIANNIAAGDFRSFGGLRGYNDWFWAGGFATGPTTGSNHSGTTSVTGLTPTVPAGCTNPPAGTTCSAATTVNVTTAGTTDGYGGVGRLTFQPLTGQNYSVHVGGDIEFLFQPPVGPAGTNAPGKRTLTLSDRPELRIDPTVLLNTGSIANVSRAEVYSVEAAAGWGPLFFQGEYFWYRVDREVPSNVAPAPPSSSLNFNGGYAEASWTITGESRPYIPATGAYGRITPQNPVNPGGTGWGAWEIAARYSVMNLNDRVGAIGGINGGEQSIFTAGLNWYVNPNIMFKLNYLHGVFEKQTSSTAVVPGVTTFTNVGANFDAVAGRMQVAF
jgi:phosphate-selective porin OprO/OprP